MENAGEEAAAGAGGDESGGHGTSGKKVDPSRKLVKYAHCNLMFLTR
jgi:hypothetical protein